MRFPFAVISCVALLGASATGWAQLSGSDRKEIHEMVYGRCYLRIQVPSNDAVQPFLEVSPTGFSWDRLVGEAEQKAQKKGKPNGVYFAFKPNDMIRWGSVSYDKKDDSLTVWYQGVRDELKVIYIPIKTLDDFKSAFRQICSVVPLQEEHSDWPAEVNTSIAKQQFVPGMTRQQAHDVAGVPLKIETVSEGGATLEVWHLRQETGDMRTPKTGLPAAVKFAGDKLTAIVP
jgi:hypothetical protein